MHKNPSMLPFNNVDNGDAALIRINPRSVRYPFCIVWTPIPVLTWLFPFIGHTGICTSDGKVRDFVGSYFVAEDNMGFGKPTKYWRLNINCVKDGLIGWDYGVSEASLVYCGRMHNLFWDNCHSHVALALNLMEYNNLKNWNTFKIGFGLLRHGEYVSIGAWLKTWLPFTLIAVMVFSFLHFKGI